MFHSLHVCTYTSRILCYLVKIRIAVLGTPMELTCWHDILVYYGAGAVGAGAVGNKGVWVVPAGLATLSSNLVG